MQKSMQEPESKSEPLHVTEEKKENKAHNLLSALDQTIRDDNEELARHLNKEKTLEKLYEGLERHLNKEKILEELYCKISQLNRQELVFFLNQSNIYLSLCPYLTNHGYYEFTMKQIDLTTGGRTFHHLDTTPSVSKGRSRVLTIIAPENTSIVTHFAMALLIRQDEEKLSLPETTTALSLLDIMNTIASLTQEEYLKYKSTEEYKHYANSIGSITDDVIKQSIKNFVFYNLKYLNPQDAAILIARLAAKDSNGIYVEPASRALAKHTGFHSIISPHSDKPAASFAELIKFLESPAREAVARAAAMAAAKKEQAAKVAAALAARRAAEPKAAAAAEELRQDIFQL